MQLIRKILCGATVVVMVVFGGVSAGGAQSLSPMRGSGGTPTEIKGFRLTVGNPYAQRMRFQLIPMEPGFVRPAKDAEVSPSEVILAPGYQRHVIFAFRISPRKRERTLGMCIVPMEIKGPVLPRVCGTYAGVMLAGGGG